MADLRYVSNVMNQNMPKYVIFAKFFGRKSPLFSLKINILKFQKDWHVAEDVYFHIKPPYC